MGMSILEIAELEKSLPPPEIVPVSEQKLQIKNVIARDEDNPYNSGRTGYGIIFEFSDHPNADGIFYNLLNPQEYDAPRTQRMFIEQTAAFVRAFNITSNNPEDWVGKEGWAKVDVEAYEGKDKNVITSFISSKA
jgi:hypothetical protein